MDGLVIVRNAGQDQAENAVGDPGLRLGQSVHRLAQREQRYARRPDGRAAGKLPDGIYRFAQLLFRRQAQKLPQIRRDKARDLFLPGLQLSGQVDGDLIDLVDQQTRRNAQKCVSCRLTDGQMLADTQEIGEMQRRVERGLRMGQDIFPQDIDLRQLDGPWDRVFQIAQVDMRDCLGVKLFRALFTEFRAQPAVRKRLLPLRRIGGSCAADARRDGRAAALQLQKLVQSDDIQLLTAVSEHTGQPVGQLRQPLGRQVFARHMAQSVDQHEAVLFPRFLRSAQQRLHQHRCFLFLAGGKQALADGLERIGDPERMLAGNFIIRVQA